MRWPHFSSSDDGFLMSCLLVTSGLIVFEIYRNKFGLRLPFCIAFATPLSVLLGWAIFHPAATVHFIHKTPGEFAVIVILCLSPILLLIGYINQWLNVGALSNLPLRAILSAIAKRSFEKRYLRPLPNSFPHVLRRWTIRWCLAITIWRPSLG
jgi:hypothetical protein